ncbi:hypothetical protein EF847_01615 [Actinobacteria bacterium YIM 96077]|uniref:Scaffolding protein n=1 Tax=Phytoactinopolyspora halophila TaxID=1981511 RepID=A0A329QFC8_9ACTN|nr:hypothetical protein [Phytoactinopolyspora halophila]AYY11617.1 hypothetical protein EF847_01615 [Actinobacteria bacterium YIM 96077]RAW11163.1 hypothetical protein DPM12_17640 [Phytoactinopolyspora halophila]
MSDNQQNDDLFDGEEFEETSEGFKNLRAAHKQAATKAKQLEEELNELKKEKLESAVKEKLENAGIPDVFLEDAKNASDLDAWVEQRKGLFGAAPAVNETTDKNEADTRQPSGEANLSAEEIEKMKGVQEIQPGAYVPNKDQEIQSDLQSILQPGMSRDEVYRQLREKGYSQ